MSKLRDGSTHVVIHEPLPDAPLAVATLDVQIITAFQDLWALGPEWRALEKTVAADLPFLTWEWTTSWWSHLHEDRLGVRDALRVCVIRRGSGELVGIAPLMLTERPGRGPLRVRTLQFIGADPNITELRSMVCAAEFERDCYQAVMHHLRSFADQWDWIAWDGLKADIGTGPGLCEPLVGVHNKSAFILGLPATWELFKQGLGRNIKQSLRHCYNSLKQAGLTHRLEVLTEPDEIIAALPDFFRLHAARANVRGGVPHTDVFASRQAREFLVDVCRRLAARGAARVFQLWLDDTLVAIRIGFVTGDTLYLYYSGWEPDYARFSVMTTLLAEVIQYAIEHAMARVNLSTGKDVSKTRWGAGEVQYGGGLQLSPSRTARAVHYLYDGAVRARTSKVAQVLTPAFLVRVSHADMETEAAPRRPSSPVPGLDDEFRLGAVAAATATMVAIDMLDGVLDGKLHLLALFTS